MHAVCGVVMDVVRDSNHAAGVHEEHKSWYNRMVEA